MPSTDPAAAPDPRAVFLRRESEVRGYCRSFPAVFRAAKGARLIADDGREWIDFLAGAGSLNYGHNPPEVVAEVVAYLQRDGIGHSLDLHTTAKRDFLLAFEDCVLKPRNLDYRVQFTNPTGTNAVEAALKLARKATGRSGIIAFTNGYHGMTLGALAATGNKYNRAAAGVPLSGTTFMPYDGWLGPGIDSVAVLEKYLDDPSSGVDLPAAVIVETVQGEGGINIASTAWLKRLEAAARARGVLLIIDDIQVGCGRTGTFFSFESAGLTPDIVVLSKSIGGCGLPFAVLLNRPDLDARWKPAEHNGTFRGNNLAFVAAAAALRHWWTGRAFESEIAAKGDTVRARLNAIVAANPGKKLTVRGRGLMNGLVCADPDLAARISAKCYQDGLIIERAGPHDEVVKCMPPLTIDAADLNRGLDILTAAVAAV